MDFLIRRASFEDMVSIAQIHRLSRREAMPFLPDLHTEEEDLEFFSKEVFPRSLVNVAVSEKEILGFSAFDDGWLDHLYIRPGEQGRGLGSALLLAVQKEHQQIDLWVFQRNFQARSFYEARGFVLVCQTNGSGNEEKEPDAQYTWRRP